MIGVANVNGVISDMDKARVSAEDIFSQTLVGVPPWDSDFIPRFCKIFDTR